MASEIGVDSGCDNWLYSAQRCLSPNQDKRPKNTEISLLVIHAISLPPGKFGGEAIEALFSNTLDSNADPYFEQIHSLRVSAHLLIKRSGHVVQFVGFDQRAWHAGVSSFEGQSACNNYSIGIELEGCDEMPFEPIQYRQLAAVTRLIQARYPAISSQRITGHSHIAPGRKTDPGPLFDWNRYLTSLTSEPHTHA